MLNIGHTQNVEIMNFFISLKLSTTTTTTATTTTTISTKKQACLKYFMYFSAILTEILRDETLFNIVIYRSNETHIIIHYFKT